MSPVIGAANMEMIDIALDDITQSFFKLSESMEMRLTLLCAKRKNNRCMFVNESVALILRVKTDVQLILAHLVEKRKFVGATSSDTSSVDHQITCVNYFLVHGVVQEENVNKLMNESFTNILPMVPSIESNIHNNAPPNNSIDTMLAKYDDDYNDGIAAIKRRLFGCDN